MHRRPNPGEGTGIRTRQATERVEARFRIGENAAGGGAFLVGVRAGCVERGLLVASGLLGGTRRASCLFGCRKL